MPKFVIHQKRRLLVTLSSQIWVAREFLRVSTIWDYRAETSWTHRWNCCSSSQANRTGDRWKTNSDAFFFSERRLSRCMDLPETVRTFLRDPCLNFSQCLLCLTQILSRMCTFRFLNQASGSGHLTYALGLGASPCRWISSGDVYETPLEPNRYSLPYTPTPVCHTPSMGLPGREIDEDNNRYLIHWERCYPRDWNHRHWRGQRICHKYTTSRYSDLP